MRINGKSIIYFVSKHYGLTMQEMEGQSREQRVALPRQISMYLMRKYATHLSYPAIGRLLGDRDHTTILHGDRKIAEKVMNDPDFLDEMMALEGLLQERLGVMSPYASAAESLAQEAVMIEEAIERLTQQLARQFEKLKSVQSSQAILRVA